ncbi:MAG: hypothetical protein OHK0011_10460 [Turneriella sp.]
MFSFRSWLVAASIAIATIHGLDGKYPITPAEVADLHNLGAGVNTPDSEYTPFITPDERFLFFQSNREGAVGPEGDFDLWYSMNKNAGKAEDPLFENAANVGLPINSEALDGHPSLRKLPTGEYEMYFSSFASATRQGPQLTNIYYSVWRGGKWTVPQPVAELNSEYHDRMPSVSQDGRYLFFSSDRPGGRGGDDIWFSEFDTSTGKWTAPQNAGNINTANSEVTPAIHSDGITLYYSSNQAGGVGGYDIYFTQSVARLENPEEANMLAKGWANPLNLGKPFNSEFDDEYPTVTANGQRVYFTSNRVEGRGAFDIYRARVPDFARPTARMLFSGKTLIAGSRRPLAASVKLTAGPLASGAETDAAKGATFEFNIINQRVYNVEAQAPGFKVARAEFDTRGLHDRKVIERELPLLRDVKIPKTVALKLSFTDSEGSKVSPAAKVRVAPGQKRFARFKAGSLIGLTDLAHFGGSEEKALLALEMMVVEVAASKKGYLPLKEKISVSELLDKYTGEVPAVIDLTLALARRGEAVPAKSEAPADKEEAPPQQEKPQVAPRNYLRFIGRIYFRSNDAAKPLAGANATVKKAAQAWKQNPGRRLFVYGHADSTGGRVYNLKLSKARGNLIKKQLIELGVAARKITVQGAGKSQPRVRNDNTEVKRQKNRRVEIYITEPLVESAGKQPEGKAEAQPAEGSVPSSSESRPAESEATTPASPAGEPVGETGEAPPQ